MSRSSYSPYKWLGFIVAFLAAGIGAILGWYEGQPTQLVILYTIGTFVLILWGWNYFFRRWIYGSETIGLETETTEAKPNGYSLRQSQNSEREPPSEKAKAND